MIYNNFLPMPQVNRNFPLPQIDQKQFKQIIPSLTDDFLAQLAQSARARGISEAQITEGLNFIKSLK